MIKCHILDMLVSQVIQSDGCTFELVYHRGLRVYFHLSFSTSGTEVTQKHCQSGRTNENERMYFSKHFRKFGKARLTRKIAWQRIQIQVARVEITFLTFSKHQYFHSFILTSIKRIFYEMLSMDVFSTTVYS